MSDNSQNPETDGTNKVILSALSELLIDNGIIDKEEYGHAILKWSKILGVELKEKPLAFLNQKSQKPDLEVVNPYPVPKKKRILIVDDIAYIRQMLRTTLTMNGYEVVAEVDDGNKAIQYYSEYKDETDVILMDIEMKGMSGLDALRQIRSFDKDIPIIIMTGNPDKKYFEEALSYGMSDFIVKPIDIDRLITVMKQFQS